MKTETKVTMQVETITDVRETLEEIGTRILSEAGLIKLMHDVLESEQYQDMPNSNALAMLLEQIEDDLESIANDADHIDLRIGRELKAELVEAEAS